MTPATAAAPSPKEGGRTPSRRQHAAYRPHEEPRRTMPPTPTRAQRQADTTGQELDQLMTILGGPAALKLAPYVAFRRMVTSAVRRDDEPNVIDGYKSSHGAAGGGGNSDDTPVERGALRLLDGQPADQHHANVTLIVANVHRAWGSVNGTVNALRLIATGGPGPEDDSQWCEHCLKHNVRAPRHQRARLCAWCRQFKSDHNVLPPEVLVRQHADGRRVSNLDVARALGRPAFGFNNADGSRSYTGTSAPLPPSAA